MTLATVVIRRKISSLFGKNTLFCFVVYRKKNKEIALLSERYRQSEIAQKLGVSQSTVSQKYQNSNNSYQPQNENSFHG